MKYATCIKQIEIDALWSGRKHILWTLDPHVNILSGINGVGKSTILNKVLRSINGNGDLQNHVLKGVHITVEPEDATHIRFDMIRSLDSPIARSEDGGARRDAGVTADFAYSPLMAPSASMLDYQLYHLQRKYLDYQVNIGNRIIAALQQGHADAAQQLSQSKARFQDLVDDLFQETGKKIIRTENEIRFSLIMGETLQPYQLSSGEKQMLAILLTVLVEDRQPYVLFMDEPEVSLHIEWQKRLIDLILELNPNVQILLTTHSPAVIMNGWADCVTEVSDITV